jgi:hypothetical protein
MGIRRRLLAVVLATVLAMTAGVVTAPPASALVLVNSPASAVKVHRAIEVGVWYREWEGGPRVFRVKVVNPSGKVIFFRKGSAPDQWKIWRVKLHRKGTFRTVYRVKDFDGDWHRAVFRTRVRR